MRDGIHKGAPVSPAWRAFIKYSACDADWRREDLGVAKRAVASLGKEISRPFLNDLEALVSNPQLIMPGPGTNLQNLRLSMPLSPLESSMVEHLIDACSGGQLSEDSVAASLSATMADRVEAELRAVEIHVEARSPSDGPELMRRMRSLSAKIRISEVAHQLISGEAEEESAKAAFDWEQDIGRHE